MSNKFLRAIAIAIVITSAATPAEAAPLPAGTVLKITKTTDPEGIVPCTNGSCFGVSQFANVVVWFPLGPGTDGGIVIGKPQKSVGQEVNGLSSATGELSTVWVYGANWGTFFIVPDSTTNSASRSRAA